MALLIECPECKKKLSASSKECRSKTGKGCGAKIPHANRIYWISYRDPNGRTKQKRIGPSKAAAENFQRRIKTEIVEGKYIDRKEMPKVRISDFIDEVYHPWCKVNNRGYYQKRGMIERVRKIFGDRYLDELTNEDIEKLKWRMKKTAPITFNRLLATISHIYTIAIEFGKIDQKPFSTKKKQFKEKGRLRYLMPDEVQRLLDCCVSYLRTIVVIALHTGMRKGEILKLRFGHNVDLEKRVISLSETKNDDPRFIPMNDTLYAALVEATKGKKRGEYLFCYSEGVHLQDVKRSFATALKNAEIKNFKFHDLRHTFASNLVMNGVDLFVVKELLGHKNIKMTLRYAHLSPHHKAKAIHKLDRIFGGKEDGKLAEIGTRIGTHNC